MYKVVRVYKETHKQCTIVTHLTREEAQAHCNNPETSSSTCRLPHNRQRTKRLGDWFDTYKEE